MKYAASVGAREPNDVCHFDSSVDGDDCRCPAPRSSLPQPIALLLAVKGTQSDAEDFSGFLFVIPD
jgi:hypothetical protein